MGFREDVKKMKALTDENRLAIMLALQHGEKCGCDLLEELNITQPTLSHHREQPVHPGSEGAEGCRRIRSATLYR